MLAEDYDGKVHVVNNQRISVTQRQSVLVRRRAAEPVVHVVSNGINHYRLSLRNRACFGKSVQLVALNL